MKEAEFKRIVKRWLDTLAYNDYFIKEAKTIRGIADIIGTIQGMPYHLELKKNMAETKKVTGRTVLQRHKLDKAAKCGVYAVFLCPENWEGFKLWFCDYYPDHRSVQKYSHAFLQEQIDRGPLVEWSCESSGEAGP